MLAVITLTAATASWLADPVSAADHTFTASADAHVRSNQATKNYGTATTLQVRAGNPEYRTFLRFDVSGLSGSVERAVLRLWVTDASPDGGAVYVVPSTWTETGITYANAPALPAQPIAQAGNVVAGTWREIDVSAAVTGSGVVALALRSTSTNSTLYSSREGTSPPQLVVTAGGAGPTPTPTPTPTPEPTPTAGPTPTPTAGPTPSPTPTAGPTPTPEPTAGPTPSPSPTPSPTPTATPTAGPTPTPGSSFTLTPVADAHVWSSAPNANAGTFTTLHARSGTPEYRPYLRFTVAGVGTSVASATLRLWVTDASPAGGSVRLVTGAWTETGITYTNAPAPDTQAIATIGSVALGTWVEIDVTSAVTGDGSVSFAIVGGSTNSAMYSSREGSNPPQLVVTAGGAGPTPTPTPTASPTPAPVAAAFSATPTTGSAPLLVTFTDLSAGGPTSWAWDFQGDGVIDSTIQNPSFVYSAAGTYSVTLTASRVGSDDTTTQTGLVVVASTGGGSGGAVLLPVADGQVLDAEPNRNWSTYASLRVRDASSERYRTYVQFDVSGISGTVDSAILRIFAYDGGPDSGDVWRVADQWTEAGLTWNTAPALVGAPIATGGLVGNGQWREYDVTAAVTGVGLVSFALANQDDNTVYYDSREAANPPQLVLSIDGSVSAPTADFTTTATTGQAPLMVGFQDRSIGNPTSWAWDIDGDGTIDSTARSPQLAYASPGTYAVTLTVTNAGGSSSLTKSGLVTVLPGPASDASDPVLVGAADIATCSTTGDEQTAALLDAIPGTVFAAGDTVLGGGESQFTSCYEPSWGRHKARTRAATGNQEYETAGAAPYFAYFGTFASGEPGKGYYSFDLGTWHIVVLNTNCTEIGGCGVGSAQETWLRQDLAANPDACIGAIGHHPRFSSSVTGGSNSITPLWNALHDAGAEFYLNGHAHVYERFAQQTPTGVASPTGIRQFTVGTGGHNLAAFGTTHHNSQFRSNASYGVQKLTLHASGYSWQFIPTAAGAFADVGSESCH